MNNRTDVEAGNGNEDGAGGSPIDDLTFDILTMLQQEAPAA